MTKAIKLFPIVKHRMCSRDTKAQMVRFDKLCEQVDFAKLGRIYFGKECKEDNGGYMFITKYLTHYGIRTCMCHPQHQQTSYHDIMMLTAMEDFLKDI